MKLMTKPRTWTNELLTALYTEYNTLYFGGHLPEFKVLMADLNPASFVGGICWGRVDMGQGRILLTVQFHPNDFEVGTSLLHEMAHVARCVQAEDGSHNAVWKAEIERLWQAGAPMHRDGWVLWPEACVVVGESEVWEWEDDDPRWYECQPDETDETGYWDGMRMSQLAEMKAGERLIIPEEDKTYGCVFRTRRANLATALNPEQH